MAVGPAGAAEREQVAALAALARLVAGGGVVAAGAGADLGGGFQSGRIDGGTGDRRDAVLAALAVPEFAGKLGPPAALLVALFGPDATKPLGAATLDAIEAGRWPELRFAVAASDLLGPEQLVELLRVRTPAGVDPFPEGFASIVGDHLARVLRPLPPRRRLSLLKDLWQDVCEALQRRQRVKRLHRSQGPEEFAEQLQDRRERYEDLLAQRALGKDATVGQAALWAPPRLFWEGRVLRALYDAQAATVLARVAVSAIDLGAVAAVEKHRHELEAAAALMSKREYGDSARLTEGLHPARPGNYVRELVEKPRKELFIGNRLRAALIYAVVAFDHAANVLDGWQYRGFVDAVEVLQAMRAQNLKQWREKVGYFEPQRALTWPREDLARRVEGHEPADVERMGDLLWLAELADATAQLRGRDQADIEHHPDTIAGQTELQARVPESVALLAARAAQLAEIGGTVPGKPRTWAGLVGGLQAGAAAAEAQIEAFTVAEVLQRADETVLPGSDARIEVARKATDLAAWAGYMGNCISGEYYVKRAMRGDIGLLALRGADDAILANACLRATGKGWRLEELKARFNADADPALAQAVRDWVRALDVPEKELDEDSTPQPPQSRRRKPQLAVEWGEIDVRVDPALSALIEAPATAAALVALRRAAPATIERGVRAALRDPRTAQRLWVATAHRPLAAAIADKPDPVRPKLAPLLHDEPLPAALRKLARLPEVGAARTAHLVALRVRAALGTLLRADDPALAAAHPHGPLLRAAALAVTSWGGLPGGAPVTAIAARRRVRLPGYPVSSLRDEMWQGAWPDAIELGGVPDGFWDRIAAHGLILPSSWLPTTDGWPALWARSARQTFQISRR